MGYYSEFIFDTNHIDTYEDVLKLFIDNGAVMDCNDDLSEEGSIKLNYIDLFYNELPFPITVFKNEAKSLKGNWASIRLSWGLKPHEFQKTMEVIMSLADLIGCRVYDGQIGEFISMDNMEKVMDSYSGGTSWAKNLFGTVKSDWRIETEFGHCDACKRIGQGRKNFLCEDCTHPEKTMLVCECGKRQDITSDPEEIQRFLKGTNWIKSSTRDNYLGITIVVSFCRFCSQNNEKPGKTLVYRIRQSKKNL